MKIKSILLEFTIDEIDQIQSYIKLVKKYHRIYKKNAKDMLSYDPKDQYYKLRCDACDQILSSLKIKNGSLEITGNKSEIFQTFYGEKDVVVEIRRYLETHRELDHILDELYKYHFRIQEKRID